MNVSVAEATNTLPDLIQAVKAGTNVVITLEGKPVAQLSAPPPQEQGERRTVVFGGMKDRIQLLPGWDDPVTLDAFLAGDI